MWKKKVTYIGMALAVSGACTKQETKNDNMIRANTIHLESMAIKEKLDSALAECKLDASARHDSSLIQKLDSISRLAELWEEGIVEVPGFEHAHHHQKAAHHEHKADPQMTDESMLDYQKNAKLAIEELETEVRSMESETKLK
jgi:multidrug resistance efflux pump